MNDETRDESGRLVSVVVDGQRFHRAPDRQERSDDLSVIETRAANATPGPWKVWAMEVLADPVGDSNLDTALPIASTSDPHRGLRTFNADFIAAARSDVPALVAEVRSLRGVVQAVRDLADEWERKAGPESTGWQVYGPQWTSVPFVVKKLREIVAAAADAQPETETQR